MNKKARQAEEAVSCGGTRTIYCLTKEIVSKSRIQECLLKDEDGRCLTDVEKQKERWVSYFKDLLNRLTPPAPPDIPDQLLFTLHISDEKRITDELLSAAKRLKTGKAPGRDFISSEMIKFSLHRALGIWLSFFSLLWQTAKFPKDWRAGAFDKLFKKRDTKEFSNHRRINNLSITAMLFTTIILGKLQAVLDPHFHTLHAGST